MDESKFRALLLQLDADPEKAAQKYRELHSRLSSWFYYEDRLCFSSPADLADQTLDRLATKILEQEAIGNVVQYTFGLARNVLREDHRKCLEVKSEDGNLPEPEQALREEPSELVILFEGYLDALPVESRALLLSYHDGEGGEKIRNRRRLAEHLGISLITLRLRTHRLRRQLEEAVRTAMKWN
jgi:DNA-directed RNA polymerase specialized sigma24 family protein